jgi:CMP-N-acetylneuraminic acid synthetase
MALSSWATFLYLMNKIKSFDIDQKEDFEIAEIIMKDILKKNNEWR